MNMINSALLVVILLGLLYYFVNNNENFAIHPNSCLFDPKSDGKCIDAPDFTAANAAYEQQQLDEESKKQNETIKRIVEQEKKKTETTINNIVEKEEKLEKKINKNTDDINKLLLIVNNKLEKVDFDL